MRVRERFHNVESTCNIFEEEKISKTTKMIPVKRMQVTLWRNDMRNTNSNTETKTNTI